MSFYHFLRCFQQDVFRQLRPPPGRYRLTKRCIAFPFPRKNHFWGEHNWYQKQMYTKAKSQAHHQLQNLQPSVSQQNLEML